MRRTLGKGLKDLLGEQLEGTASDISVDDIEPNARQPRTHFDKEALQELADSIREHGILQPLLVRPRAEGKYELIAGERRLRASKLAGLKTVPVLMRSAGNQNSLELALIENIQRENINPVECARAYRRLIDEFDLTQEQVAEKVGKSRTGVANTVRLLRLPKRIIDGLEGGRISEGHARALLAFDSEPQQLAIYDQIIEKGLTVREVEKASKPREVPRTKAEPPEQDPNDAALQDALSTFLGTPTKLVRGEVGGKLVVEFYSDDDLTRVLDVLGFRL
ncbi:ParB/RepB/Spo0J family partition protein [Fimbriimonas ginsengisoli]|uniref:Stage 0 sporulation protein J n=1 Tax=Fimbriimonas ginsengisoli Gsoil 348 TaxID=661478 RepID=A0A068NWH5_FIMGI|nr:ParB/RepB/Spo0J family partition protein [Fimbriimonas ginsengisoli]AIE87878.1 stage 0 sporulation protein J [Fimbriimonas ginsengisoli Gsoil 348]